LTGNFQREYVTPECDVHANGYGRRHVGSSAEANSECPSAINLANNICDVAARRFIHVMRGTKKVDAMSGKIKQQSIIAAAHTGIDSGRLARSRKSNFGFADSHNPAPKSAVSIARKVAPQDDLQYGARRSSG